MCGRLESIGRASVASHDRFKTPYVYGRSNATDDPIWASSQIGCGLASPFVSGFGSFVKCSSPSRIRVSKHLAFVSVVCWRGGEAGGEYRIDVRAHVAAHVLQFPAARPRSAHVSRAWTLCQGPLICATAAVGGALLLVQLACCPMLLLGRLGVRQAPLALVVSRCAQGRQCAGGCVHVCVCARESELCLHIR